MRLSNSRAAALSSRVGPTGRAQTPASPGPRGQWDVLLAPGAQQRVTFPLDDRSVSIWDVRNHSWNVVQGSFGVLVGSSSRDIRLVGSLTV